jgi:DNA-directed RNA polymerase subunit beta'
LIFRCYQIAGHEETVRCLDRLKALGFEHATLAGISIGLDRHDHPGGEAGHRGGRPQVRSPTWRPVRKGIITDGERYNKIIDIWTTPPTARRA